MNYAIINSPALNAELTSSKYLMFTDVYKDEVTASNGTIKIPNPELNVLIFNWLKLYHPRTDKVQIIKYQDCEEGNIIGWRVNGIIYRKVFGANAIVEPWQDKIYVRK